MEEHNIREDIQYLRKMMENNRRMLVDNGISYISSGIFVAVGVPISIYLGYKDMIEYTPYLWIGLMIILIIANLILGKKKSKQPKNFGSDVFNATWKACGIPAAIISFGFFLSDSFTTYPFFMAISAILGIGYYLTGVINKLPFMKILAYCWWAVLIMAIWWNKIGEEYQFSLIFAIMVLLLEVIPGIIIYKKWKYLYND